MGAMTTELDDLRRELAEARAVLADFLAERRPGRSSRPPLSDVRAAESA